MCFNYDNKNRCSSLCFSFILIFFWVGGPTRKTRYNSVCVLTILHSAPTSHNLHYHVHGEQFGPSLTRAPDLFGWRESTTPSNYICLECIIYHALTPTQHRKLSVKEMDVIWRDRAFKMGLDKMVHFEKIGKMYLELLQLLLELLLLLLLFSLPRMWYQ